MMNLSGVSIQSQENGWKQPKKTAKFYKGNRCSFVKTDAHLNIQKTEESAQRALEMKLATAWQELAVAQEELKFLKLELKEYKNIEASYQPTTDTLNATLKKANQVILNITKFEWDMNVLATEANLTAVASGTKTAKPEDLQADLTKYDLKYNEFIETYRELMPIVESTIADLKKTIGDATHASFSEKQFQAISAKQGIPLDKVKSNEEEFDAKLNSCSEIFKQLTADALKMKNSLNNLKIDLNNIDHQIVKLENPTSWNFLGSYWGKQNRISPLDKNFSIEKLTTKVTLTPQTI